MGYKPFTTDDYRRAKRDLGITRDVGVTHRAERQAKATGKLSEIVDPAVNPIRRSLIRMNPHGDQWIVTMGCPMDIELSCDTTGSMGSEVDTEMRVLPELYAAVAEVLPDYDPQLCLGIFGDVTDDFVLCRPQFEMEADKIVNYLKEMAPQRDGGDAAEDPQYAMFARAYLTDAYTNRIGLKGYHFIATDAGCHRSIDRHQIQRIFGTKIFENELLNFAERLPSLDDMVRALKEKTHQFVLVVGGRYTTEEFWQEICGENAVIGIDSTAVLPAVIAAIIGLTEGTLDITNLHEFLEQHDCRWSGALERKLSMIPLGAQAMLRAELPQPIPMKGDIFAKKTDLWPVVRANG